MPEKTPDSKALPTAGSIAPASVQTITGAAELLAAGKALGQAIVPANKELQPYAVIPDNYTAWPIPRAEFPPLLDHIRQSVTVNDEDSFIAYVKAFRTHTTRVFASQVDLSKVNAASNGGASFVAILDYHEGGPEQAARRGAHVVNYPVPLSLEFATWLGRNKQGMRQADFVQFVEDNAPDIVNPDAATLQELVLNFQSRSDVKFQSKINRTTGGVVLSFSEEVEAGGTVGGQLKCPEFLDLRMPIFEGGIPYDLRARLEYRTSSGGLSVAYHLQRPHQVFRFAMKTMREEIATALDLEVLTGSVGHNMSEPGVPSEDADSTY